MSFLFQLTVLDWIFLVILISSVISSIIKGFAREAISLGSIVLGLILAAWFYPITGSFFINYVKTQDIASLLGFMAIFLGCAIAGALVSWLVYRLIKLAQLEWFDRLLGGAFGVIRGWLVGSVLFLAFTAFPLKLESVQNARFAPYLLAGARILAIITPRELSAKFLEGYRKIENIWAGATGKSADKP
jgi:membrane protein required for colicin V production